VHLAVLISEWAAAGQTTFFVNGTFEADAAQLAQLASGESKVEREPVVSAGGEAPGIDLRLRDGRTINQPTASEPVRPRTSRSSFAQSRSPRALVGQGAMIAGASWTVDLSGQVWAE
jgi:hypothetical protein